MTSWTAAPSSPSSCSTGASLPRNSNSHNRTQPRSDVVCEYPLKDMLAFHTKSGGEATILVSTRCRCNVSRHRQRS